MPTDQDKRRTPSWVCLRCKPKIEFFSKEEWDEHYSTVHPPQPKFKYEPQEKPERT